MSDDNDKVQMQRADDQLTITSDQMDRFALCCIGQAVDHLRSEKVPRPYILMALKVYEQVLTERCVDSYISRLAHTQPSDQEKGG